MGREGIREREIGKQFNLAKYLIPPELQHTSRLSSGLSAPYHSLLFCNEVSNIITNVPVQNGPQNKVNNMAFAIFVWSYS